MLNIPEMIVVFEMMIFVPFIKKPRLKSYNTQFDFYLERRYYAQ